ncbi:hypothetical protein P3339_15695 [Microbulbifer sp. MLAF003]|uniref:hypothetical protein n=1 Tax=Microbulbifer sp. MLAF003 TaxID=3032582 RepID=UPI0024ACC3A1|nr:hypothetical protein [Microbulbifer sp. MLAF003]WHI49895.1 hypothetical protein P3339_15695 [Microbulbifer sp. MLAF003]
MEINTQSPALPAVIVFAIQALFAQSSIAQVYVEADQLLRVIEDQQRQLEEQEAQIQRQKAALDALRQQVEELRRAIPQDPSPPPRIKNHPPEISPSELEAAIAEAPTDWPGSIQVTGTELRIKIGGFAELDANYDTGAIVSPAEFTTSAIVTSDRTAAEGEDGQTNVSVQVSRLELETKMPWGEADQD